MAFLASSCPDDGFVQLSAELSWGGEPELRGGDRRRRRFDGRHAAIDESGNLVPELRQRGDIQTVRIALKADSGAPFFSWRR